MIYTYKNEEYDLSKVTRLYPAAVVEVPGGDSAQVSLEWADSKSDKVSIAKLNIINLFYIKIITTDHNKTSTQKR